MHFLVDDITKMTGVYHVVPTNKYQETGEWKILVDRTKSPFIHRQLQENWNTMLSQVPSNFLEATPTAWPTPKISSKKIREYQDDSSAADSYGSLLTNGTNDSLMTTGEDELNDLPPAYQYKSYASAAGPPTSTVTATTYSSPTTSEVTEWHKEKSELETMIRQQAQLLEKFQIDQANMLRDLQKAQAQLIVQLQTDQVNQIEKIQADIQAKESRSKDLEDQLAQAIDLAYNRNMREDEMLKRFERLMSRFPDTHDPPAQMHHNSTDQLTIYGKPHTTPPRSNTSKESPPPKKANTNSSPQRDTYKMFKPPANTTHHRSNQHRNSPPSTLTQPMEEDDILPRPPPMANLGKKIE